MSEPSDDVTILPAACTLGTGDGARRSAEWREVIALANTRRSRYPGRAELRFAKHAGIEAELRRLVDAETVCCAFLDWDLRTDGNEWIVTITGSDEGLDALPPT